MLRTLTVFTFFIFFNSIISAQCPDTNTTLDSQQDVIDYISAYSAACTVHDGNLTISGNTITDISGLSFLKEVTGDFRLQNMNSLSSLTGLNDIFDIGGLFQINKLDLITDLNGLGGFTTLTIAIENGLYITNNALLQNIDALSYIESPGPLSIYNNPSLTDCSGICSIISTASTVSVYNNPSECSSPVEIQILCQEDPCHIGNLLLDTQAEVDAYVNAYSTDCSTHTGNLTISGNTITDISGLSFLREITGELRVQNMNSLASLSGLEELKKIGGLLQINNVDQISDLSNLGGLSTTSLLIENGLYITNNALLENMDAFDGIDSQGPLSIYNNPNLTDCSGICSVINIASSVSIYNNPSACSSPVEVQLICNANSCHEGNLLLDTQAEVNAYVSAYSASCTVHDDNLTISGNNITDISGLSFLTEITGELRISNMDNISSLTGLENITTVGGLLQIHNSDQLTNLTGLTGAALMVGNGLYISNNNLLENIDALAGMTSITGTLQIYSNPALLNLDGLTDLASVSSTMAIYSNASLTDCSGICPIINSGGVASSVSISNNPSECSSPVEVQLLCQTNPCHIGNLLLDTQAELDAYISSYSASCTIHDGNLTLSGNNITDISGLSFLMEITGDLRVQSMDNISSLAGLDNISSVGGLLQIHNSDQLADLSGLTGSTLTVGNGLYISNNNLLENIDALLGMTSITGTLQIYSNPALLNLDGLTDLASVSSTMAIYSNASLTDCSGICPIINSGGVASSVSISNNPSECSSPVEVQLLCQANPCHIGNLTLDTQAELNAYVSSYSASCTIHDGNLTLSGNNVTDISGLSFLTEITGDLRISNMDNISSLTGMENISTVGGLLQIHNSDQITDLTGLTGAALMVGSGLYISNNNLIENIDALIGLTSITGTLQIYSNPSLLNLDGLQDLTFVSSTMSIYNNSSLVSCGSLCNIFQADGVQSTISIYGNPAFCSNQTEIESNCTLNVCAIGNQTLQDQTEIAAFMTSYSSCDSLFGNIIITGTVSDISGLAFIEYLSGNLTFQNNNVLTDMSGFTQLELQGNFIINNCDALTSVQGMNVIDIASNVTIENCNAINDISELSYLTTISGNFLLNNNDLLTNLSGLENLINVNGNFQISNHALLSDCSSICNLINTDGVNGSTSIYSNPTECSSVPEVELLCTPVNCPSANIVINNQLELEAFVTAYGACPDFPGNLTIRSNSVTDISALSFLTSIEGNFILSDLDQLSTYAAFNNIITIDGDFTIEYSNVLTSLSDFNALTSVGGNIYIRSNSLLVDVGVLSNLTTVIGSLRINSNPALTTLSALSNLTTTGYLQLFSNSILPNLSGLENLTSVAELSIGSNGSLTDCSAICSLINADGVVGPISIISNPSECSSLTEVELICTNTCPIGNVVLNSQNEIDAFVANQSSCDSIFGNLTISGSTINDLSQLSFLRYIQGNLLVQSCPSLTELTGLNGLIDIGGMDIRSNAALTTISALSNLTSIDNSVIIWNNASLINLDGLNLITSIGGNLNIRDNSSLVDLSGLDLLQTVGGTMQVWYHINMTNLSGISALTSVGVNLRISNNSSLTNCSLICSLINNGGVGGSITIAANPSECSSLTEVSTLCTDTDCPEGTVVLSTQIEVDAFVNTFFGCDSLPGGLTINGASTITDLSGLSFINHIGDNLIIQNTQGISDLSGFQNLQTVAGQLRLISNNNLTSIAQLAQLISVDGELRISSNQNLPNINGLEQLTSVNGNLNISYNPLLADCAGICMLINNSGVNGSTSIFNNPSQCSSLTEVSTFCSTSDCPSGDVILTTQSEVDAFVATFSSCDSLSGDLFINGNNNITDITDLSFISYVGGDLKFENSNSITSLDGLQNITGVGGDLRIYNNQKLENIDALSLVDTVFGQLNISYNDSLSQLNGIIDIAMIATNITVRFNQSLTDCDGLCGIINDSRFGGSLNISSNPSACSSLTEVTTFCTSSECPEGDISLQTQSEVDAFVSIFSNCDSIPGDLIISGGNNITDLSGLSFITYVEGNLSIKTNYQIVDLGGFENLAKVNGDFIIQNNINLTSISQLSSLIEVGGMLSIYNNDLLVMLGGLEQLTSIGSHLRIQQNATLSDCSGVCDLLQNGTIGGNIQISANPSQCSTANEVESLCEYGSLISTIYINNLPTEIEEGTTLNFEVAVDFSPSDFLEINLSSSNDLEIPLPQTVTITPGQTFVPVSVLLPDNNIPEQNKTVTISAGAEFLTSAVESILLSDDGDIPAIEIELLQDTISEAGGFYATQGLIRRVVDDGSVLNVRLFASQNDLLLLPEGVNLSASEQEKEFFIGVLDNAQVDGFKDVDITAKYFIPSCNCDAEDTSDGVVVATLVVSDDDGSSLMLQVNPLSLQEGKADAGDLTITRNTATDQDLEVFLSVSDETELSLPVSVIIPQGSASITIPITTLNDPITDGNQEVTIQANSPGFSPGTIWVIVTDINKPDFKIADVIVPETNVPSNGLFEFRALITNEGLAAAPSGATLTGYFSKDLFIDDNDFLIGDYILDASLLVGDTIELPDLGLAPFQPRDYYLLFEINSDETITELLYLNNRSEPINMTVLPDYLGSAFADQDLYVKGSSIPITGSSFKPDNTPVPNADLEIYITVGQVRREISVTTDSMGNYATIFEPLPYEAGHYSIGASFPEQGATAVDDEFDILGFKVNNGQYVIWELLLNEAETGTIAIENLSEAPLTNVTISTEFLPTGCTLTFDTISSLPANGVADINYQINGSEVTQILDYIQIPLSITGDEVPDIQEETSYYFCQAQQGYLRSEISSINTTMNKDNSRIIEFKIFNDGMGQTEDIEVLLPQVSWLKLVSLTPMVNIPPGDTAVISLNLVPTDDLPLNTPGTGNIVINASNGNNLNIPYTIQKVSDETGDVVVDVIDQYTYFTDEAPHVEGASVKITHYFTGEVFAEGVTDADGLFSASDIPEGTHRLVVQAQDHFGYDGLVVINPGLTRDEVVFIEYQTISFSWDVVPTTIEDEYQIDLIIEFETNVPAPVVLMEMPDTMPQLFGDETFPFFITLTNVGLITANEVELQLPDSDSEYVFVTNYEPQDLLAQQAIQVPVEMKRRDAAGLVAGNGRNTYASLSKLLGIGIPRINNANAGDGCTDYAGTVYWYECGPNGIYQRGAELFSYEGRSCPGSGGGFDFPTLPGGPGGGGSPSGPGGGDCNDCGVNSSVPSINIDCKCNDCLKNLFLATSNCAPGIIGRVGGFVLQLVKGGNPFSPPNCVDGLLNAAGLCGCTVCDCVADIADVDLKEKKVEIDVDAIIDKIIAAVSGFQIDNKLLKATGPEFPSVLLQPMNDIAVASYIDNLQDYYAFQYFGFLTANENINELLSLVSGDLKDELMIDVQKRETILAEMAYFDMPADSVEMFIDRWNTTLTAWNAGVLSPNATYPDIIDKAELDLIDTALTEADNYIASRGYQDANDMTTRAIADVVRLTKTNADPNTESAFNPVCASVTINISQTLTMVREAFEGTLSVFNGHPTDALQNLSLNLEILDENGVYSNDLFSIETTELNTLTEIDGTGMLGSEMDGFAKVLFIPESGAAPENPRFYSFGGTISYLDPFSDLMVTLPLIPVTLTVNPSPDLFLHYFMQRDIYGDDPLTAPIEPIIPADLAVMIENNGYGVAQQVVIESAQPEIVDNDKGLAVNFSLIGSNLQGEPFALGLNTINFGDIQAFKTKIGQWYFTSTLLGHFTNYETNVVHLDSRGNPDLSLVSGAEIHELHHTISVYGDADDGIDDFLVNDIADTEDNPDAIFLSQGSLVYDVFPAFTGEHTGNILAAGNTTTLTVDPLGIGWNYIKLDDPGNGNFEIISVTRNSDNQVIPLKNVWLTHVTIPDGGVQFYEDKFHFVDDFPSFDPETYTVIWSPLDPTPPEVLSISGHPSELTSDQVTTLQVKFTEEIIESSFGIEDLMLSFQGGANLIDASVVITQVDSVTYDVDIASLTTGNGFYVFTAQAAGVEDLTGTSGDVGKQVSWTQFLSVPVVQQFIGLPADYIASSFDTVNLLFNVPLDVSTLTVDDIAITLNGIAQSGSLTLTEIGDDNRLFKLSGLASFLASDDSYMLEIDLLNILSSDQVNGLVVQSIPLILDSASPMVTNMVRSNVGGLDDQHYTKMTINFSEDIEEFDTTSLTLLRDGVSQLLRSSDIQKVDDDWYEIIWDDDHTYPEANYEFAIDVSDIRDLAGNLGSGVESQQWTVDRTAELTITNLNISPDLGFSATDGITSVLSVDVSFEITDEARDIAVYQNDNGILSLLATQTSATSGMLTFPVTFVTGGQTSIEVWMEDLQGNQVMATKVLYLDESQLSASWDFMSSQTLSDHPAAIDLLFTAAIVDLASVPAGLLSLTKDNNVLDNGDLVLTKLSSDVYQLTGLDMSANLPGTYTISVDLSYFTKYSSGVEGAGFSEVSWQILDLNQAPISIAGEDVMVVSPMTFMLEGDDSFDPDGDMISYTWYPPAQVALSDSFSVNPVFDIDQSDHNEIYTFLLEVSDGDKTHTDNVSINVTLRDSLSLVQALAMQYCSTDTIDLLWKAYGDICKVNIILSDDGGSSFDIPVVTAIDAFAESYKISLEGLSGSDFVLAIEDTLTNGYRVESEIFSIDECSGEIECTIVDYTDVSCYGASNGTITVDVNPGAKFTYSITPVAGINNKNGTFTELPAGTYSIVASSSGGAMALCEDVVISEPEELEESGEPLSCLLDIECLENLETTEDWIFNSSSGRYQSNLSETTIAEMQVVNQQNSRFSFLLSNQRVTAVNPAWFSEDIAGAITSRFSFIWDRQGHNASDPIIAGDDSDTTLLTIQFDQPVINPTIHIDRLGGYAAGKSNSSEWTLMSTGNLEKLAGTSNLIVNGNSFYRSIFDANVQPYQEATDDPYQGTAAGSIRINTGTLVNQLVFQLAGKGYEGTGGDDFEIIISVSECSQENDGEEYTAFTSDIGIADGQVQVFAEGGQEPFSFSLVPDLGTNQGGGLFTDLPVGVYTVEISDASHCGFACKTFNVEDLDETSFNCEEGLASSADVCLDEAITLYPNPVVNEYQIKGLLENYDIKILNSDGTTYEVMNTTDHYRMIDLNNVPSGLYFISIRHKTNQNLTMEKIIKN